MLLLVQSARYWGILLHPFLNKATFFLGVLENMKQKIIIKVSMHCSKCRSKAMQIASVAEGVTSVALHGPEKDKLLVQGEGIDAACLTSALRKKLCHASLEIVEEVKEKTPQQPKPTSPVVYCPQPQPHFEYFTVVSQPSPGVCTIM